MQTENLNTMEISWKQLENNISVGHFTSTNSAPGYKSSQIYVKKYEALKSNSKNKVTIFLFHDICQHHGRFQSFIDWAREKNPEISFVAMDFVGHGLSSGTRGHFEKFDHLVTDVHFLLNHLEKNSNDKWIVMGHGLGGLVALDLYNRFQDSAGLLIDGLILSNFILKFQTLLLQLEDQNLFKKSGLEKFIAHSRPLRIFKSNEILSFPEDILNYEQDPLVVHRPTLKSMKEIQKKITNIYQDSYFLGTPLMLIKSEHGVGTLGQEIDYFAKGIKKDLLTEKKYSLMRHDLYNEREKEIVFQDIMNWMNTYET